MNQVMDKETQSFDDIEISDTESISSDEMDRSETQIQSSEVIELSDTEMLPNDEESSHLLQASQIDTEYDGCLRLLPFIAKKPNIKKVIIAVHTLIDTVPISKKCEQCNDHCTFCKYHVDIMGKVVNAEALENVCQATNVGFLVYCIECDQVWIAFTKDEFKNVSFGFHGYKRCQSQQRHNKRNIQYMMIDKFESEDSERMLFWRDHLGLRKCDLITETASELDAWRLVKEYHYMLVSDMQQLFINDGRVQKYPYDSEHIVYLIVCTKCFKKYVGKTMKTFIGRYRNVLSKHEKKTLVYQHFNSTDCTIRNYRWTVIDALSDDQIYFLEKWRYVFNKCEINLKKKLWVIISFSIWKDLLVEILWENNPVKAIQLIAEMNIMQEDVDNISCGFDPVTGDVESSLRSENEKWIKNTIALFIADRESYWINTLHTLHDGLNTIKSAQSKGIQPNLYNDFFKSLGNK